MRADRLLSILLLLQANGRMSAGTLARRLEVSRRTIYRDVEALGAAGVPVVVDQGRDGGVSLLAGWRTDVTGLTEQELSALLAFASSGPAADLGLGEDVGRAAQKVAAAASRGAPGGTRFQDRILIDNDPWMAPRRVPPHLARVQDALWADRRLQMRYRRGDGTVSERVVDPYGLIAKNGVWYLLAGTPTGVRTFRVSRVEEAAVTEEPLERPAGFDLEQAWHTHTATMRPPERFPVTVRADPVEAAQFLRFAARFIRPADPPSGPGEDTVVLEFAAPGEAAFFLASFGGMVEVLDPPEVRERLAEIGRSLAARYGG
ncbi:MAG TPA: transcriptional regulator [Actinomycetota bacterium]|nr:transcriptional regulator [Actinomycetota bacterium]